MTAAIEQFHFLRPFWLLALIPIAFLGWKLWNLALQSGQWRKLIPDHLLKHLLEGEEQSLSRFPAGAFIVAGIIAVIALAGPAWRQISTPVEKSRTPLVLVVDLSRSMLAADPKPNRMVRAKQKLTDIVRLRKDGLTAIVAYAGDSHTVTPLTDDSSTLINMIRALSPDIMPVPGSNPEKGIARAIELMQQGASQAGTILLLTDGIEANQSKAMEKMVNDSGNRLSILGFGSETGAPVPAADGGFQRDRDGAIVMAQLDRNLLAQTARATGGHYSDLSLNDSDILSLIPQTSIHDATVRVDRSFDNWHDEGRWLVLLLLPFVQHLRSAEAGYCLCCYSVYCPFNLTKVMPWNGKTCGKPGISKHKTCSTAAMPKEPQKPLRVPAGRPRPSIKAAIMSKPPPCLVSKRQQRVSTIRAMHWLVLASWMNP